MTKKQTIIDALTAASYYTEGGNRDLVAEVA